MTMQQLLDYCLTKKGAVLDHPFGPEPDVMKAGGKMFALLSGGSEGEAVSLKCDPFIAEMLRGQYEAVKPGYHLNKKHWNTVTLDGSIPENELREMVDQSYELVVLSLPKAEREKLGFTGTPRKRGSTAAGPRGVK